MSRYHYFFLTGFVFGFIVTRLAGPVAVLLICIGAAISLIYVTYTNQR